MPEERPRDVGAADVAGTDQPDAAAADPVPSDLSPTAPEAADGEDSFPIVGIGASAGGLRAYQAFFDALPPSPDMAFVLVQHLSPDHESALAELLQSKTDLSVNQVTKHPEVRPNCVYVIPPGKHLELKDGHLELVEIRRERGKPTSIDHFFRSLAREVGERAVAVVLSGTGSDGALGLKAVKERAGLTLAQTPDDAEYDGMPRSAVATGLVDLTGTPAELARRLVEVRRSALTIQVPEPDEAPPASDERALRTIFAHLRQRTNHDFTHYKRSTILRRLARRLQVVGTDTLSAYSTYLRSNPEEAGALLRDFLISVTQFFRDPDAFDALEREVLPDLLRRSQGQIRVWVPGCATGEEAYTLAMLLCEHADRLGVERPDFQVFATDIDEEALGQAREGFYTDTVAGDLSPERLRRFFDREGSGYRVKPSLRELVLFAPHNLVADPPFSRLDLVSCRNVLIYFNRTIQERAFASFHYALRLDGYLFLGPSESPDTISNAFVEVDRNARIYRRRDVKRTVVDFPYSGTRSASATVTPDPEVAPREEPAGLLERYEQWTLDQYAPPRLLVDERYDLTHVFGRAGDYLRDREGPVTQNAIDKVLKAFRIDLRTALYRAFSRGESIDTPFRRVELPNETRVVRLHVGPVGGAAAKDGLAEVVFIELDPVTVESLGSTVPTDPEIEDHPAVVRLEEELQISRSRLQATIEEQETSNEELKASNEELQSINEELQSATEELETSKEELQSMNEELTTVNQELKNKVEELTRSNSDLQNLMSSMEVATVFLDAQLRLKRYTPRATGLFHIIPGDLGRPFAHVAHTFDRKDLEQIARSVHETLTPVEEKVRDESGQTYLLRIVPYRTVDDRIDGVVLTFVDVSEVEKAKAAAEASAEQQGLVAHLGEHALEGASLPDLFVEAVRGVLEALGADACKVLQHEPEYRRLRVVAGVGWTEGAVGEATVPDATASQAGYTLLARETVRVEDLGTEVRFTAPALLTDHGLQSGMSVVIPGAGATEPWGVLGVHCRDCRAYSEADGRFLQSVANVLADAIEAERRAETIRQQVDEIEAIYATAPVGLAFLDGNLRYRRVNQRLADINGRPIEDHLGKHTRDVIPDLSRQVEPLLEQILETGEAIENVEVRGASPADPGDQRVWLCSYVPRLGADREPLGISLVVRDVTARARTEEALEDALNRLELAMEGGGLGSYHLDMTTGETSYDEHAQQLLQEPAALTVGEAMSNVHPDDADALKTRIASACDPADEDDTFTSVHRQLRPDGSVIWLAARGRCLFEGDGDDRQASRLIGIILDVTDLKEAQELAARRLAEIESYFDAVPVGIAILDREGRYMRVNEALASYAGLPPRDLEGRLAREVFPSLAPHNESYVRRVLETGLAIVNVEMELPPPGVPDGDPLSWLVNFQPIRSGNDEDEVVGVSVVAHDVTLIRRAQRGLERLTEELEDRVVKRTAQVRSLAADLTEAEQRERQRVAQVLHDDLQQLLYALEVKHHLIRRALSDEGAAGVDVSEMLAAAEALLTEAVQSTRSLTVDLSPPILRGEGIDGTLEWLAHRMREAYGLDVAVEVEGDMNVDRTVHILLYRVVREVLFNIVKHAGTHEARLAVGVRDDVLSVEVVDEGVGFDQDAHDAAPPDGLGLLSVRERIALVGGTVEIASEPGGGTTVIITCPLSAAPSHA